MVDRASDPLPPPQATARRGCTISTALPDAANVLVVRTERGGRFFAVHAAAGERRQRRPTQDPFAVTEVLPASIRNWPRSSSPSKSSAARISTARPPPPTARRTCPRRRRSIIWPRTTAASAPILLDRLSQLLPGWGGTSEADLGVALAELIAYVGDHLSYQQDAVATEAYLETARSRVSLRRHALLVDYHVHDGCNARAWMQLDGQRRRVSSTTQ